MQEIMLYQLTGYVHEKQLILVGKVTWHVRHTRAHTQNHVLLQLYTPPTDIWPTTIYITVEKWGCRYVHLLTQ
jgi:hypothetical protein